MALFKFLWWLMKMGLLWLAGLLLAVASARVETMGQSTGCLVLALIMFLLAFRSLILGIARFIGRAVKDA